MWKAVSGVRTYFFYADEGLIGEYDSTGAEIKTYGYKPGSTWTTDPLFMKEGSSYYFYHTDHLGTPQKMTAVNGAVVWSAKYSSFGEAAVDAASTITNSLRFPGQYEDTETGLHYNYFRCYDPRTGRYLRTDPLGLKGYEYGYNYLTGINQDCFWLKSFGKDNDINHLYSYTSNNPIKYIDIKGLKKCPKGQHVEKDMEGFLMCMATSPPAIIFCPVCVGVAIWAPSGYGIPIGIASCFICLYEEIRCMDENTKCVCD